MGLTIHYQLATDSTNNIAVREVLRELHSVALDLPFAEVSNICEFQGDNCAFNYERDRDSPWGWLKLEATRYIVDGQYIYPVSPIHILAVNTWAGGGCESASFGLSLLPETIIKQGRCINTNSNGWCWQSFCKTQYAFSDTKSSTEHFFRCHLSVIRMLDEVRKLNILYSVDDEGEYWEKRSLQALITKVTEWNEVNYPPPIPNKEYGEGFKAQSLPD